MMCIFVINSGHAPTDPFLIKKSVYDLDNNCALHQDIHKKLIK